MSKTQQEKLKRVKEQVKKYVLLLNKEGFPVEEAYIFGSFARGDFKDNSDIDVCIISPRLRTKWNENEAYLWTKTRFIDSRIEPIGYSPEDFRDGNIMAQMIKKEGIKIII